MKSKLLILIFNLAFTLSTFGQKEIPNGIYPSIHAFRKEQTLLNYKVEYKNLRDTSSNWVSLSEIKIKPKVKKMEKLIWGFSDGYDFFINSRSFDPGGYSTVGLQRYCKLIYKGRRYGIFWAVINLALPHQRTRAVIDMKSGKMVKLTKQIVKEIIKHDQRFVDRLESSTNKKDLIEIIIDYDSTLNDL